MRATDLIGMQLRHTSDQDISGEVTDVLFDFALKEVGFVLTQITTPRGTAPVLFSPTVLKVETDALATSAQPEDILARHDAAMNRTSVPVDPADLPSTFIGPFGNTFSLSMIAALFNARIGHVKPDVAASLEGVWMSELSGHAVRAHVADIGHIADVLLDDHFTRVQQVLIKTFEDALGESPPEAFEITRSPDGQLLVAVGQ